MNNSVRAFTLIELLVVISIIAVLASIVLASLSGARDRAVTAAGLQFEAEIYHASGDRIQGDWEFDECGTAGTTAGDSSANGNTGTLIGSPSVITNASTPSGRGCALGFNGSNQDVSVTPFPIAANPLTISAWVYPTALSQTAFSGSTSGGTIVDEDEGGGSLGWVIGISGVSGTHYDKIWFWPSGGQDRYSIASIPLNKWTFIAATYDGTNLRLYINGTLDSTQAMTAPQTGATFFKIGAKSWITGYWAGDLDNVRIYGGVFTASEVQKIYAEEKEDFLAIDNK